MITFDTKYERSLLITSENAITLQTNVFITSNEISLLNTISHDALQTNAFITSDECLLC